MMRVFEGNELGKMDKKKDVQSNAFPSFSSVQLIPDELLPSRAHFRFIEQNKFQFNQLYLQSVEKDNHLPNSDI